MRKKEVAVVYKYIPQYRLAFFEKLDDICRADRINLRIIYGNPGRSDRSKGNEASFEPGVFVPNRFLSIGKAELIWQPVFSQVRSADLIIVEQANKLLLNYFLAARQIIGLQKFAFWGHGKNLQATGSQRYSEYAKKWMVLVPHWWFAYTDGTARYVERVGFPADRITVVYNAIDTENLTMLRSRILQSEVAEARRTLGITSDKIAIYVGSMYQDKRIDFLLDACSRIKERIPEFYMIFIGAGSDEYLIKRFCVERSWATCLGPVFGREKVKYLQLAKLFLMPGLVGLAILDAFALGLPIITTDLPFHSPEIEYLENGRNGLKLAPADNVDVYVEAVVDLLRDEAKRQEMAENCRLATSRYTIENMAARFFEGITRALAAA